MLVDAPLITSGYDPIPALSHSLEAQGFDGIYSLEGPHDALLPLAIAAQYTERVQLTTSVVIAFARNPMTLAQAANDLHLLSHGRFNLGLGTQIKPHIEKRFSMEWSKPAARMREFVQAIRAIWASWNEGERLDFRGDFYTHTLMTPFFNPGKNPYGTPNIVLGGVGPLMTEVAGEVADGFMMHPFSTEKFMRETTLPALERGLEKSGRSRDALEVAYPAMIIVAENDQELEQARNMLKPRLGFYGSTPAYKVVLDAHGWGDIQPELNRMTKTGDYGGMVGMITDEIVDTFATIGTTDEIAPKLKARYGDMVARVSLDSPVPLAEERTKAILTALHA